MSNSDLQTGLLSDDFSQPLLTDASSAIQVASNPPSAKTIDTTVSITGAGVYSPKVDNSYMPVAPLAMGKGLNIPSYVALALVLIFGGLGAYFIWLGGDFSSDEQTAYLIAGVVCASVAGGFLIFLLIYLCVAANIKKKIAVLQGLVDVSSPELYRNVSPDSQWKAFAVNEYGPAPARQILALGGVGAFAVKFVLYTAGGVLLLKLRSFLRTSDTTYEKELTWIQCLEIMAPVMLFIVGLTHLLRLWVIKRTFTNYQQFRHEHILGPQSIHFGGSFVHEKVSHSEIVTSEPFNLKNGRQVGEGHVLLVHYTIGRDRLKVLRVPLKAGQLAKVREFCTRNWSFYKIKPAPKVAAVAVAAGADDKV
jgi:hypothetical protein